MGPPEEELVAFQPSPSMTEGLLSADDMLSTDDYFGRRQGAAASARPSGSYGNALSAAINGPPSESWFLRQEPQTLYLFGNQDGMQAERGNLATELVPDVWQSLLQPMLRREP